MAFLRRNTHGVAQAFRSNSHLQQFMLSNVSPTGMVLGTGSYGSVEEVKYGHLVCAGKKLHETLIDEGNIGVANIVSKYEQECQLMSSLRHPNITQFLGLCFLPGTRLPLLVMERLETSLDDLLEHMPGLPLSLKRSILEDMASGLVYLHERQPQVIHRDLTANNVLLTSSLIAKITDMGNSRIIDMRQGQMARTLSCLPGTLVYMPPEALNETHRYGPSLDVFSFGHLVLYTIIQIFPGNLLAPAYPDCDNPEHILGRSEVERREEYIRLLEEQIGRPHPALVQLVKECLYNVPERRPATDEVLNRLQRLKVEVEGVYGGSLIKLDMGRVLLAKELKMKDKKIEELREVEERAQERTEQLSRELEISRERQEQLQVNSDRQLRQLQRDIEVKDEELQQLQRDREESLSHLRAEMEGREARLREELQSKEAENTRLMEELRRCQKLLQEGMGQGSLLCHETEFPLQLNWRCGPDMPFEMADLLSVVVQGKVYVGGGSDGIVDGENNYIVMEYDVSSGKWDKLPRYETKQFAMTAINNQLVLVGGKSDELGYSRSLGAWRAESKEWIHLFPDMPTARNAPSAVTYKEWLVVVGGTDSTKRCLSSIDVMNIDNKQWYGQYGASIAPAVFSFKTAIVGDLCYFMGGQDEQTHTDMVHSVSLPALISEIHLKNSRKKDEQIWKRISGLGLHCSTPLFVGGSLLALGGWDKKDRKDVTAIHCYRPKTGEWEKVGNLPSPRNFSTCAIANGQLLVAGGQHDGKYLKSTVLSTLSILLSIN